MFSYLSLHILVRTGFPRIHRNWYFSSCIVVALKLCVSPGHDGKACCCSSLPTVLLYMVNITRLWEFALWQNSSCRDTTNKCLFIPDRETSGEKRTDTIKFQFGYHQVFVFLTHLILVVSLAFDSWDIPPAPLHIFKNFMNVLFSC